MGWGGHDLISKNTKDGSRQHGVWRLWTRGGTQAVFIRKEGTEEEIEIPSALLRLLVADDVRMSKISRLEQATDDEVLGI
jgi:hypothetical protein